MSIGENFLLSLCPGVLTLLFLGAGVYLLSGKHASNRRRILGGLLLLIALCNGCGVIGLFTPLYPLAKMGLFTAQFHQLEHPADTAQLDTDQRLRYESERPCNYALEAEKRSYAGDRQAVVEFYRSRYGDGLLTDTLGLVFVEDGRFEPVIPIHEGLGLPDVPNALPQRFRKWSAASADSDGPFYIIYFYYPAPDAVLAACDD